MIKPIITTAYPPFKLMTTPLLSNPNAQLIQIKTFFLPRCLSGKKDHREEWSCPTPAPQLLSLQDWIFNSSSFPILTCYGPREGQCFLEGCFVFLMVSPPLCIWMWEVFRRFRRLYPFRWHLFTSFIVSYVAVTIKFQYFVFLEYLRCNLGIKNDEFVSNITTLG